MMQLYLGTPYEYSLADPQNYREATRWHHRTTEQGVTEPLHKFGTLYTRGRGTPQDNTQAYMWFTLAAVNMSPGKKRDLSTKYWDLITVHFISAQLEHT
jgi:hypothetical protein